MMSVRPQHSVVELDETFAAADPPRCGVQLKAHQLALLRRCVDLESGPVALSRLGQLMTPSMPAHMTDEHVHNYLRTRIGVLGDKVGSGKSYVILSIVLTGRGQPPLPDPIVRSFAGNRVCVSVRNVPRSLDLTLLVVPHNLCTQWDEYIRRFGGGLRHLSVNRSKHVSALSALEAEELAALDLVVVTNTFYNAVASVINRRQVRRVIFDEADSMAIPGCQAVDACFHWFVTASWLNLLVPSGDGTMLHSDGAYARRVTGIRSSGFIKNVFAELYRSTWYEMGHLASSAIVVRCRDSYVDASLLLPEPVVHIVRSRTPALIRVLHGMVDQNIIDCLNAGDVDTAMQHISPHNRRTEDNIVVLLLDNLTRKHHNLGTRLDAIASHIYDSEAEREAERTRVGGKMDALQVRMDAIRDRVIKSDSCCICYEPMRDPNSGTVTKTVVPCCSNAFCFACINMWLARRTSCPLCKAAVGVQQLMVVTPDPAGSSSSSSSSSGGGGSERVSSESRNKMENLEAILRERCTTPRAAKVLLFSAFDNTFNGVVSVLARLGIKHRFLKGNHFSVSMIEKEYREGDLDVLLVNTTNYGSGLNFENTTDVIMLHKFDTDIEKQVIGRAQRCGRTQPLNVWYLLYANEIV